ncbi:unnamed protein product, partial [Urochloa humidicola]
RRVVRARGRCLPPLFTDAVASSSSPLSTAAASSSSVWLTAAHRDRIKLERDYIQAASTGVHPSMTVQQRGPYPVAWIQRPHPSSLRSTSCRRPVCALLLPLAGSRTWVQSGAASGVLLRSFNSSPSHHRPLHLALPKASQGCCSTRPQCRCQESRWVAEAASPQRAADPGCQPTRSLFNASVNCCHPQSSPLFHDMPFAARRC